MILNAMTEILKSCEGPIISPYIYQDIMFNRVQDLITGPRTPRSIISAQTIPHFRHIEENNKVIMTSFDIERGLVGLVDNTFITAALGKGKTPYASGELRSLHVSAIKEKYVKPMLNETFENLLISTVNPLKVTGEFYVDRQNNLRVNAWPDQYEYGGEELNRTWSQPLLMSTGGLNAGFRLILRMIQIAKNNL